MQKTILLIDAMNLCIRNFAAINTKTENGDHSGLLYGTIQSVRLLLEQFHPSIVIFSWEGKNAGKRRKDIFQNYKDSRKVRKSLNKQFQWEYPEQEKESLKAQLFRVKEYLSVLPFYDIEIENQEADDIIAYICNYHFKNSKKIIVSSDKDYFQLINDNVSVYRPVKKEIITKDTLIKSYNISPQNWIILKCIGGDKSDDIPGIGGIQLKITTKIFPFLNEEKNYDLNDIYTYCENNSFDNKKTETKYYKKILENKEILEKNYRLMQLKKHEISAQGLSKIKDIFQNKKPIFSPFKLRLLFLQDNAHGDIHKFTTWQQLLGPLSWKEELLNDF